MFVLYESQWCLSQAHVVMAASSSSLGYVVIDAA